MQKWHHNPFNIIIFIIFFVFGGACTLIFNECPEHVKSAQRAWFYQCVIFIISANSLTQMIYRYMVTIYLNEINGKHECQKLNPAGIIKVSLKVPLAIIQEHFYYFHYCCKKYTEYTMILAKRKKPVSNY